MSQTWTMSIVGGSPEDSDEELRKLFGNGAVISRVGKYNLIHLDSPSQEEVDRRVADFDPDDLFEDDCPLCQLLREGGGNVVFDDGIPGDY